MHSSNSLLRNLVGVFLLLIAISPGRYTATDAGPRLLLARQIWNHASVSIPDGQQASGLIQNPETGTWTSLYGIGQTLALLPFDFLGVKLAQAMKAEGPFKSQLESAPIFFLYVPIVGTLWWLLLYAGLIELGVAQRTSIRGTHAFFFSTIIAFYAAQSTQEEALVAVLLLSGLLCALRWKRTPTLTLAIGTGLFAGAALTVRLNAVFGLLPLVAIALEGGLRNREAFSKVSRGIGLAIVGLLPAVAVIALFSFWRFGSPFSTGYDVARDQGMGVFWGGVDWISFLRLVAGPGKGLLVLSPPILISLLGLRVMHRQRPLLVWSIGLALVFSLLICAKILNNPEGSESWGTRYQVHLLSFLVYPFCLGWKKLVESGYRSFGVGLVTVGVIIQFAATFAPPSMEYFLLQRDSIDRAEITASPTNGQLPARLRGLVYWFSGRSQADRTKQEVRPSFVYAEQNQVPGYWGPIFSKRFKSFAFLFVWMATLGAALVFLFTANLSRHPLDAN